MTLSRTLVSGNTATVDPEVKVMSSGTTLVANNHYQGKEMVNALQLKALLTGQRVPVPALLSERYPELKAIAAP